MEDDKWERDARDRSIQFGISVAGFLETAGSLSGASRMAPARFMSMRTASATTGLSSKVTLARDSRGTSGASRVSRGMALVAIVESGRGQEIGLAAFAADAGRAELRQFSDDHVYSRLLMAISVLDPLEVLMPASAADQPIRRALGAAVGARQGRDGVSTSSDGRRITFLARRLFSEMVGLEAIERCAADTVPVRLAIETPYKSLALEACGALMQYVEHRQNTVFCPRTIQFVYTHCEDALFMDASTAQSLELLQNEAAHTALADSLSVCQALNRTRTRAGGRLLRLRILEPPADAASIEQSLDALEALLGDTHQHLSVVQILHQLPDVESALAQLLRYEAALALNDSTAEADRSADPLEMVVDARALEQAQRGARTVRNVLLLKRALELIPPLLDALERGGPAETGDASSPASLHTAFQPWCERLRDAALPALREDIQRVLSDEAATEARGAEQLQMQTAFAVRTGVNGLLDAARGTLSSTTEQIYQTCEELKRRWRQPRLHVCYNARRGYHLSLPWLDAQSRPLSSSQGGDVSLRNPVRASKSLLFTTDDLARLNTMYHETLYRVWLLSVSELKRLRGAVQDEATVRALHRLCDTLAALDVATSLASAVSEARTHGTWTRPRITAPGGPLAIQNGRHMLLESVVVRDGRGPFVPNDAYLDEATNVALVFGANASGKSVLAKQVALIALLAHVGCYVPADYASIPTLSVLLVRSRTDDSLEHNLSSFALEMREAATALQFVEGAAASAASRSRESRERRKLVVFDELGRATSAADGKALAWALLEHLSGTSAYVLFATHFHPLAALEHRLPNVRAVHMRTTAPEHGLVPEFKASPGASPIPLGYGVAVAARAGLPEELVEMARQWLRQEHGERPRDDVQKRLSLTPRLAAYARANQLYQRLLLLRYTAIDRQHTLTQLARLRQQYQQALCSSSVTASAVPPSRAAPDWS